MVPEWNKDTQSFNALVEAAAIDLHCYIVQANNRKYGDSRVREPSAKEYHRDVVRLKGGTEDYFAVGELRVRELRDFQLKKPAFQSSKEKTRFKPLPEGFRRAKTRK